VSETALRAARSWLGTPYRHQASTKGVGADCLGLVRGVWRETVGPEPETVPAYAPDWAEMGGEEALLQALGRRFVRRGIAEARPGDVVVFRMAEGAPAKHCGVLATAPEGLGRKAKGARMIHAYWGRAVVESWMGDWWLRRLVAVFAWPETREAG
jgi:NlpC/P60 family putative phage cell wall peptidase